DPSAVAQFRSCAKEGIILSGYIDAGYTYNFSGSNINYRAGLGNNTDSDGGSHGDFNLNALKVVLEKPLSDANEFQAGFRADLVFGEDASDVFGGSTNGSADGDSLAVEQAYVNFRMPVANGVDVAVGKFVTWLGYEVFERPANLNITYGNLFWNAIPADHTGVAFTTSINDTIDDVGFAIVNGINTDDGISASGGDEIGVMAKVNLTNPSGNANLYQAIYYGFNETDTFLNGGAGGTDDGDIFIYDAWGNWMPTFANGKLLLGINGNFAFADTDTAATDLSWWGSALYAKYQFTDIFSLAGRADYLHSDAAGRLGATVNDLYSITITAGFDLLENLLLRAEYRVDITDDETGVTGTSGQGHTIATQAVYSF
ncbi:MAG: outer membrane beta-barrel protein, partial [Verrucomicrobiota bacterium]